MIRSTFNRLILFGFFCLSTPALAGWPVALTDQYSMHVKERANGGKIDVLANDTGTGLLVTQVNAWTVKGGRAYLGYGATNKNRSGAQNVTYYPPTNFTGVDSFWYVIEDNQGRKNAAKVTVTVKPEGSRFPNPANDTVSVQKNKSIRINVLKNDIFRGDKGEITQFNEWSRNGGRIRLESNASSGIFNFDSPQLVYTPRAGFTGTDEFWYAIRTRQDFVNEEYIEHSAKVTITVTEGNRAGPYPIAKEDFHIASYYCGRGFCPRQNNNFFVTVNDIGKNLKISSNRYSMKGGTVNVSKGNKAYGPYINYVPSRSAQLEGTDKIWYTIEDEVGRKNWGTINLTIVLEAPIR